MTFSTDFLSDELAFYIEAVETDYERRSRIISVKLYLMEVILLSELDFGTAIAKRARGEYNRSIGIKEETYTEEMYVNGTPFRTAFAYITENQNSYYTLLKYAVREHGNKAIDFHRLEVNVRLRDRSQETEEERIYYDKFLIQDTFHNSRVSSLKGENPVELWEEINSEIEAYYN